ncbi:hypothetical protein DMUE_4111 [Dictyocoela muelleri]|nr:hypothetical protein DMUE_4111 [Dictyocoela muelleri]
MQNEKFYLFFYRSTLYNSLSLKNSLVQVEIKNIVSDAHDLTLSISTVCRKINKVELTRKRLTCVPNERNSNKELMREIFFATEVSRISNENLVFLDETGFNEHIKIAYGYFPKNTKAYITVTDNRGINKSLHCSINSRGLIGYEYLTESYNSNSFLGFLERVIVPYFITNQNSILIMDNAQIHKTNSVLTFLREKRILYRFNISYTLQLNPIEEFFYMLKSKFVTSKLAYPDMTIENLIDYVCDSASNYSIQCLGFYRNMRIWLEKARRGEPFI